MKIVPTEVLCCPFPMVIYCIWNDIYSLRLKKALRLKKGQVVVTITLSIRSYTSENSREKCCILPESVEHFELFPLGIVFFTGFGYSRKCNELYIDGINHW